MVDFFDLLPAYSNDLYTHKKMKTNPENSLEALQLVVPVFEGMTDWSYDAVHDALIHLAEEQGLKNGRIMWPVRVAVSGKPTTPGGAVELCQILGKEETLRRIQQGIQQLTPRPETIPFPAFCKQRCRKFLQRCFFHSLSTSAKAFPFQPLIFLDFFEKIFYKTSTPILTVLIFVL